MPTKADGLAAFDAVVSGGLDAFDEAVGVAPATTQPPDVRSKARANLARLKASKGPVEPTMYEGAASAAVNEIAGFSEGVLGTGTLAADLLEHAARLAGRQPVGVVPRLPRTEKLTKFMDKRVEQGRRAVGVRDEAITDVRDAAGRLIGNVIAPTPLDVPAGKVARKAAALKAFDEAVTPKVMAAAEEVIGDAGPRLSGGPMKGDLVNATVNGHTFEGVVKQITDDPTLGPVAELATANGTRKVSLNAVEKAADVPPSAGKTPAPQRSPVQKMIVALREAKPLRAEQEAIYTKTRAERIKASVAAREGTSGEAGFYAELAPLKGEMPHVQFESLRKEIGQDDIDDLFNMVRDTPVITDDFQKAAAREGLAKMFGEYGGQVPTDSEIALLRKVFGTEFTDEMLAKRPMFAKFKELGLEIGNIPRAVMASGDLSAPLRQGAFFIGRPRQFFPAFKTMFRAFGSEKAYQALEDSISARPSYELMRDSGLAITDLEAVASREERFASNLAEKIPVIGRGVRASGRAYTGFLNKLRADVFDDLVAKATAMGLDVEKTQKNLFGTEKHLAKSIADFINTGTGRGDWRNVIGQSWGGAVNSAAPVLNAFFFSPKLMASRLTLLNPAYYLKQPAFVRQEALKSLFTFVGTGATVASLAKMGGAEVGLDPRSSDFGKIIVGNTRFDVWGGFQQYVRMAAQLATNEYKSVTSGNVRTLGEGYKPITRYDILARQIESKEAPIASFVTSMLRQQDYQGMPVSVKKEVAERLTPMLWQDIGDLAKDNPALLPFGLAAVFGVGVQTFAPLTDEQKEERRRARRASANK